MKPLLRPSRQVIEFVGRLAPEPRRAMKHALANLREGHGDIKALESKLAGYHRLRVGKYRIIFQYARDGAIEAIFIEERALVYDVFEAELVKKLKG